LTVLIAYRLDRVTASNESVMLENSLITAYKKKAKKRKTAKKAQKSGKHLSWHMKSVSKQQHQRQAKA